MTALPAVDERALEDTVARARFSGVVTVDVGDRRVLGRAYGFAHRAHRVPNTVETRFGLASGGKTFTAVAVMRLVETGVLDLGDPVRRYLGEDLPLVDDAVTIEHLLEHTSGIGDYLDEEAGWDVHDYVLPVPVHLLDRTEAFVPVLDGFPQTSVPGERFAYCNGGDVVLALVAERASGRPYHELVEQEVCARAGLARTGFPRSDELPADVALGYLHDDGDRSNVLHLPVRGNGDGGICSTASDLHRFWRALVAGEVVSPATLAAMTRPRHDVPAEDLRHGLGLWLHRTGPALVMEGYDPGVSFRSTHDPTTATTVSVLGNTSEGAWPVIGMLARAFD
ncbi:serine hydrolase [Isoptericola variabilis]|uniref:Beta-lactamase n=1 Tax=Isoptericola variabilis (strain 225) TaxID=743718 RepID=F6FPP2_ISOV2|nr:serine hydrolase domain-containing protein [Isoptericola variabilis]AEG44774.1 beta-lactamase [Isoptericola variabilis 225]TWH32388.1 CubicO group peptidase (beta-lactamase class C family) [Isoptericola variabilis J7]